MWWIAVKPEKEITRITPPFRQLASGLFSLGHLAGHGACQRSSSSTETRRIVTRAYQLTEKTAKQRRHTGARGLHGILHNIGR